jgi:hypothetical protein
MPKPASPTRDCGLSAIYCAGSNERTRKLPAEEWMRRLLGGQGVADVVPVDDFLTRSKLVLCQ